MFLGEMLCMLAFWILRYNPEPIGPIKQKISQDLMDRINYIRAFL